MSDTHEIITLQFGNFANHVGAHFWNIQVGNRSISLHVAVLCSKHLIE
jgi:hypothetical protein